MNDMRLGGQKVIKLVRIEKFFVQSNQIYSYYQVPNDFFKTLTLTARVHHTGNGDCALDFSCNQQLNQSSGEKLQKEKLKQCKNEIAWLPDFVFYCAEEADRVPGLPKPNKFQTHVIYRRLFKRPI